MPLIDTQSEQWSRFWDWCRFLGWLVGALVLAYGGIYYGIIRHNVDVPISRNTSVHATGTGAIWGGLFMCLSAFGCLCGAYNVFWGGED